ncbi:MAG: alkaline phosphatase family protein [Cyclobacteriaceae bacterium]|nr:alkaline phosphatase family protein [Cyclobacteriaceae bacterium]
MNKGILVLFLLITSFCFAQRKTENVVLITLDGLRWLELFQGADSAFMRQQKELKDPQLKEKYWRNDLVERRKALLPFFWNTIATKGQLLGNREVGSKVNVTNQMWFSYPGYNEILTGKADDERINSNDKTYNPNTNVLEFLNKQPAYKGKVAAFSSWDVFPHIINDKRSGVYVSTGWNPVTGNTLNEREKMMNLLVQSLPNPLGDVRLDAFTFYYGLEYMKKNKPRVMYFAFDETDDFAHHGEYGAYLNAAHYTDRFIAELWDYLQADTFYKNKTTLLITTDHGRGTNAEDWKHHGKRIAEADQIWFAVLGPDTDPKGEVKQEGQFYQRQVAQTLASFLGYKFPSDQTITDSLPVLKTEAK